MASNSNPLNVAVANEYYRSGRFAEAIHIYEEISKRTPYLARQLEFNIRLCEKAISHSSSTPHAAQIETYLATLSVEELLERAVPNLPPDAMPSVSSVLTLLDSLNRESPSLGDLKAAVLCAYHSPFQRDLLWYVGAICRRLMIKTVPDSSSRATTVRLADLVNLASDERSWFLHRHRVEKWSEINNISDPRLQDLIATAPDNSQSNHTPLPRFRISHAHNYSWNQRASSKTGRSKIGKSIGFGSILLNERKFIGLNLLQHYDLCETWWLVEGACQGYPTRKVTDDGLSLDDCSSQIRIFPDPQNKLRFIQHGWTTSTGEDAKSELRNRYLSEFSSEYLVVVDVDEFYIPTHLEQAISLLETSSINAVTLPQVHFWKNTSQFITGEYYDVSHTRIFRYHQGMHYLKNHNFPEIGGKFLTHMGHKKVQRTIREIKKGEYSYVEPCCFHMGFAKDLDDMRDKSQYYINRGEAVTRKSTTDSRASWFSDDTPANCKLHRWGGEIPSTLMVLKAERS